MSTRPTWRKSSYSGGGGGNCVEVASLPGSVGVRDSKNPGTGHQAFSPEAFGAMVHAIKVF
ncbi:DUF397 domain-containing protein [Actinocorallia sp. API 0066]|uniref:DUF397 domain-containing protein n=1 Tax=Actinocorallia sp. API 0066 TaxID=2896846 RepID=UPI001E56CACF|nr:DUF397 domain-containing protein [Actinocorallia sp. API 0066]MCD0447830.1 DUF397 domain-containing protein [Actinocorallia sp. API 0066]